MKTFRLDLDFEYDFDVYGIVSSSKSHTLAWALNKYFNLRLVRQQDLCYDFISKGSLTITNYLHQNDHYSFRLLRNKSAELSTLKKPFLVPEIKEYDYIIRVSGAIGDFCQQEIIDRLKQIPFVQYVKSFDPNNLRFKENLMF